MLNLSIEYFFIGLQFCLNLFEFICIISIQMDIYQKKVNGQMSCNRLIIFSETKFKYLKKGQSMQLKFICLKYSLTYFLLMIIF